MKRLNDFFDCNHEILIESIQEDSRAKENNYLFFCIEGLTTDGHLYASKAVENGAVAVVASKDVDVNVPIIKVKDTNRAMSKALSIFYNEVDKKLKLIGVTGTDGKTTVSSIVYQIINTLDNCAYIGTNGIECKKFHKSVQYTTPFPKELYSYLNDFYNAECNYVSMEVSSERLLSDRLNELLFDGAIFTNITRDHLDKHKTMDNYIESKSKLFKLVKEDGYSIINNDEQYSDVIKKASNGKVITYGINNKADVMAEDIIVGENKLKFTLNFFDKKYDIISPLSGMFNVYNIMASFALCVSLGFDAEKIIEAIKGLKPIGSRLEYLNFNQSFKILLDYAHTANALKNLLEYVNVICKGKIITVTGSAGNRDSGKRPNMGEIVTKLSDYVIFTTDDPRNEDPNNIIDDLITNIKDTKSNYERILDRTNAIHKALSMAKENDIVVIAGKGRDTYMAINNEYVPYSDVEAVTKFFIRG